MQELKPHEAAQVTGGLSLFGRAAVLPWNVANTTVMNAYYVLTGQKTRKYIGPDLVVYTVNGR